jgi:beta-N-acetylhexosaminidase
MRYIIILMCSCCLLIGDAAMAQKKKGAKIAANTNVSKTKKVAGTKAVSKKAAKSNTKRNSGSTVVLPPLKNVGDFERSYTLTKPVLGIDDSMVKDITYIKTLDVFINNSIQQRAFPGCQVLAAKDGKIIYKKNFGYTTYDKMQAVSDSTLYDIASVTKVAATTLAVMKLYEEGKINLSSYLKNYLPFTVGTDKAFLTVKDILLHQAGLKAFIPFYKSTIDKITGSPSTKYYRTNPDALFGTPVASNFYILNSYADTIWQNILQSNLDNRGRYVYSDLDFYFLEKIVEAVSGQSLEDYVTQKFYVPLGLKFTAYNPWKKGWKKRCAPTENDNYFRFQLVQGYVHDPGTAMLGGVAGHAGIFSNAMEVATILQMLNNGGVYNGVRYLKKETLQLFTGFRSNISRRGYGFDKPEKARGDGGPASDLCSKTTFGHQGFTGTCAWADPETGIVFVFLSNRVYPSADNGLINSLKVRYKAQNYIYQALGYGKS